MADTIELGQFLEQRQKRVRDEMRSIRDEMRAIREESALMRRHVDNVDDRIAAVDAKLRVIADQMTPSPSMSSQASRN